MIRTETDLYLKSTWFGKAFQLDCQFNFRALRIELHPNVELPVIRMMLREKARENLHSIFDEEKYDKYIGLHPSYLTVGALDWAFASHAKPFSQKKEQYYVYKIHTGFEAFGGGLSMRLYNDTRTPLTLRNLILKWHYVNNDLKWIRQMQLGSISAPTTVEFYDRFQGVKLSNVKTTIRKRFSSQVFRDYTEPNWIVELYVNDNLVDFTQADETGYYEFHVPVRYGSTRFKFKFLGPWGEERFKEAFYNVPHVFLPPGETEYSLSMGQTERSEHQGAFLNVQHGISNRMTCGLQSHSILTGEGTAMQNFVFLTSFRLMQRILLSGQVHSLGNLVVNSDYSNPSGHSWQFSLKRKIDNEIFNRRNLKQHLGFSWNFPHLLLNMRGQNRIRIIHEEYTSYDRLKLGFHTTLGLGRIHPNLSTEWEWRGGGFVANLIARSQLSFNLNAPHRTRIRPMLIYDHQRNEMATIQINAEKPLFQNGWLSLYASQSYSKNFTVQASYRHDFAPCRFYSSTSVYKDQVQFAQSISGGIAFVQKTRDLLTGRRGMINRGGLVLVPFLDLNNNELYDENEPRVPQLDIITNQGQVIHVDEDTVIYIMNLSEYSTQLLKFSNKNFENISWSPKYESMGVTVQPHIYKHVHVPIIVQGEIWGNIYKKRGEREIGLAGIKIRIEQTDGDFKATVMSMYEGYFEFMGLPPGQYKAFPDKRQIQSLGLEAEQKEIRFDIQTTKQGDFEGDMIFKVSEKSNP